MTTEQLLVAVLSVVVGLVGVGLTIRNWFYGGSVIRVELDLGRRDPLGGLVTGTVSRWRDKDNTAVLATQWGAQVDLVKVTVRNLGRTPATIHEVGLRGGSTLVPLQHWTAQPNFLVEPGETGEPLRIEAHDVKVFYFHALPVVRAARVRFGDGPLAFRAAVMTGTGKQRLSRCWRRGKWNIWTVQGAGDRCITGQILTTREQARLWVELTQNVYEPDMLWVRQISDQAAKLVEQGVNRDDAHENLTTLLGTFGVKREGHGSREFINGLVNHLITLRTEAETLSPPRA